MPDIAPTGLNPGKLQEKTDLILETIILLVFGIFMFLYGTLQIWILPGKIPYNPDGAYGILLVIIALQMITLGKTPYGTFRRTWFVIILGMGTAVTGTVACFIPGLLERYLQILVGIILLSGGGALLARLILSGRKARLWIRTPGYLTHLAVACGTTSILEMVFGCTMLIPGIIPRQGIPVLSLFLAFSLFHCAWSFQNVIRWYRPDRITAPMQDGLLSGGEQNHNRFFLFRDASLSTLVAILLLLGVIFNLFPILLFPVSLGLFSFSRDSQFGLLMVIMAIQVLALGKTPLEHSEDHGF
jgi:hypothetical protein